MILSELLPRQKLSRTNSTAVKLTIGIPIYNGELTIAETLDSIFRQITSEVEVVISDNASTDGTKDIVESYCRKYEQIRFHTNEINLGADRNIDLTVSRANGEFVWLMGDDDEIEEGGIDSIIKVIDAHPDLAAIFVNYSSYDRITGECLNARTLKIEQDVLCADANSFLKTATIYPNFMSSIIVRRSRWLDHDAITFAGTHWLQYGMLMKIIEGQRSFCVSVPYVINRGIEFNGPNEANRNGVAINILINLIDIVDALPRNIFTNDSIAKAHNEAHKFLPRKIFSSKRHGLKLNAKLLSRMTRAFGRYATFWIRDFPLLLLPRCFHYWAWRLYKSKNVYSFFIKLTNR